uniref:Venom protein family 2 protein 5 n=1 Tax=Lethocerus distinctifemur TaxID=280095 RepID=A0A2K8JW09_9HEMI|nr:venom protein family 2 protein 5 [Lethocerus distinctifemur]
MTKFFLFALLMGLVAAVLGDFVEYDEDMLDEEMVKMLSNDVNETRKECTTLEQISVGPGTKAGIKDKLQKMCSCQSHKECQCCAEKTVKIPIIGTYTFSICSIFGINPAAKTVSFKIKVGPIKVMEKEVSFSKIEQVCKKIEKFKHVEFCTKMEVSESQKKGLTGCLTIQVNIMDIFNKPFYLPCLNFKDQKLTMDENMDDYKDDGVRINLKALWKKFKGLFGKKN